MKRLASISILTAVLAMAACGGGGDTERKTVKTPDVVKKEAPAQVATEDVDPMTSTGIGPVSELTLDEKIDPVLAEEGKVIYEQNCTACHKPDKKYIGPAPKDILERRTPEWVMNMIMNPTEMVKKDPIAKKLLAESNGAIMADQNITEDQARAILEYFRTL